jgi:hypothetical protein
LPDDYFISPPDHPPDNCWIDSVEFIDLYLDARHRARVSRGDASVTILGESGEALLSFLYLRSECPFDLVEKQLGVSRVEEIRNNAADGSGEIAPYLRDSEEENARVFREQHQGHLEALEYVQDALKLLDWFGSKSHKSEIAGRQFLANAAGSLEQGNLETARHGVSQAIQFLTGGEATSTFLRPSDWHRALAAIDRQLGVH